VSQISAASQNGVANEKCAVTPNVVLVFGILLAFLIAGCRGVSPVTSMDTHLLGRELPLDDERADRVFRQYLETSSARSALRGSARVALEGPDFKLNRPQRILVERPDRLRFEIIGLFDQIAAMLAVDGDHFGFYDAQTGEVSRGEVTPSLLWDLARIDLDIGQVVGILLGAPRPSHGLAQSSAWLAPEGGLTLVFVRPSKRLPDQCREISGATLGDPLCFESEDVLEHGGELFYFDLSGRLVEIRSLERGGRLRYKVAFEDYQLLAGDDTQVEFPNRVTIRSAAAGSLARFVWKRVMLADELSDRFFELRPRTNSYRGG
jgi:hypothetical protein